MHQQSPETETAYKALTFASRLRSKNGLILSRIFILGVITESSSTNSWRMRINLSGSMLYAMTSKKIKNSGLMFMVVL